MKVEDRYKKIKLIDIINKKIIEYNLLEIRKIYKIRFGESYKRLFKKKINWVDLILNSLFGKHEKFDYQQARSEKGHPDLLIRRKKNNKIEKIYVELKYNNDDLRISQIEWILKNNNKKTFILCLSWK